MNQYKKHIKKQQQTQHTQDKQKLNLSNTTQQNQANPQIKMSCLYIANFPCNHPQCTTLKTIQSISPNVQSFNNYPQTQTIQTNINFLQSEIQNSLQQQSYLQNLYTSLFKSKQRQVDKLQEKKMLELEGLKEKYKGIKMMEDKEKDNQKLRSARKEYQEVLRKWFQVNGLKIDHKRLDEKNSKKNRLQSKKNTSQNLMKQSLSLQNQQTDNVLFPVILLKSHILLMIAFKNNKTHKPQSLQILQKSYTSFIKQINRKISNMEKLKQITKQYQQLKAQIQESQSQCQDYEGKNLCQNDKNNKKNGFNRNYGERIVPQTNQNHYNFSLRDRYASHYQQFPPGFGQKYMHNSFVPNMPEYMHNLNNFYYQNYQHSFMPQYGHMNNSHPLHQNSMIHPHHPYGQNINFFNPQFQYYQPQNRSGVFNPVFPQAYPQYQTGGMYGKDIANQNNVQNKLNVKQQLEQKDQKMVYKQIIVIKQKQKRNYAQKQSDSSYQINENPRTKKKVKKN